MNFRLLFLLLLFYGTSVTAGNTYLEDPDSYYVRLKQLQPGDYLHLKPGIYRRGLPIHHLQGNNLAPIIISGSTNPSPVIFLGRQGHNTVSIINSSHVTIRNLVIDGIGLPVDGIKCEGHANWAHHITLENLQIYGHDHNQGIVAISTKCPAWNWIIRNNIIKYAGTGIYLGNSDGSAPFIAGLIEHNLITHTMGYNLQIKHQLPRPKIPNILTEKQHTIIRHNVFSKAERSSTHQAARPNLLVGHWPAYGSGRDDEYLIYGNFFYQNTTESLFQGEGRIAFYNNLLVNHQGNAVRIQSRSDQPDDISIFFNTIVTSGAGIITSNPRNKSASPYQITHNAIFAGKPQPKLGLAKNNLVYDYQLAQQYLIQPYLPPGQLNLNLIFQNPIVPKLNNLPLQNYLDWNVDFDGKISDQRFGAYINEKMPRWYPNLEIKPILTKQKNN